MKYTIDKIVFAVYILCIWALVCLFGWANGQFSHIEEVEKVKPRIYKIVEYADDDPIIEKEPPDIIEESEEEIIEEAETEEFEKVADVTAVSEKPLLTQPITAQLGTVQGPQSVETYYNRPMERVVDNMRSSGYTELDYPYYVREDGVKMLGDFIIVATDINVYPRGTIVETSLGQGIVCDHCETPDRIDIAVEW